MSVRTELVEEFNEELKEVKKLEVGTEKHKTAVDAVTKLADRIIEIKKLESDVALKEVAQSNEHASKMKALEEEKKDRKVKNGLQLFATVGGWVVAGLAFVASVNFEKEGTITTEGGKSSLRQLLKFK